jgi:hypothetical protein
MLAAAADPSEALLVYLQAAPGDDGFWRDDGQAAQGIRIEHECSFT